MPPPRRMLRRWDSWAAPRPRLCSAAPQGNRPRAGRARGTNRSARRPHARFAAGAQRRRTACRRQSPSGRPTPRAPRWRFCRRARGSSCRWSRPCPARSAPRRPRRPGTCRTNSRRGRPPAGTGCIPPAAAAGAPHICRTARGRARFAGARCARRPKTPLVQSIPRFGAAQQRYPARSGRLRPPRARTRFPSVPSARRTARRPAPKRRSARCGSAPRLRFSQCRAASRARRS